MPCYGEGKRGDPVHDQYARKLLIPGWPGELTDEEYAYIRSRLQGNRQLRARWGFSRGTGRLQGRVIRRRAAEGVPARRKMARISR